MKSYPADAVDALQVVSLCSAVNRNKTTAWRRLLGFSMLYAGESVCVDVGPVRYYCSSNRNKTAPWSIYWTLLFCTILRLNWLPIKYHHTVIPCRSRFVRALSCFLTGWIRVP